MPSYDDVYIPPQRIGFKTLGATDRSWANILVSRALAAFGLAGYKVVELTQHSNVIARLVSGTGPELALRLRTGPSVDGRTEFEWLNAVRRGTSLRVVQTFADDFASNTRVVEDPAGMPTECSLFLWAPGIPLAADLSPVNYYELGRMTAELHSFAANWAPSPDLQPLIWDRTMYYKGTSLVISDPRFRALVSRADARRVEAVVRAADDELARLASRPDRIYLHGNIEMWNVLVSAPGELRLLDFEDVMFGHPVQDVVITLYYGRERPDYADLSQAYEAGYRNVRDWPALGSRQIELLTAARAAMLLNHALQTEPAAESVAERLLPLILAAGG